MELYIASAGAIYRALRHAVRLWIDLCIRYASRSFAFCYDLWRSLLSKLAKSYRRRKRTNSKDMPENRAVRRNFIAASELPLHRENSNTSQTVEDIPLQGVSTPLASSPTTPPVPLRSCLRNSSTSSESPKALRKSSTFLSGHLSIVTSPMRERRSTVGFDDVVSRHEVTSPTPYSYGSPTTISPKPQGKKLVPFYPDLSMRYDRSIEVPSEPKDPLRVKILTKPCREKVSYDNTWTAHTQPEGQLYFSKEIESIETVNGHLRLYTEAYLITDEICREMDEFVGLLENELADLSGPEMTYSEVVLEILTHEPEGSEDRVCNYYLVNHANRSIGWFEEFPAEDIASLVSGVPSLSYLHHFVEKQYWIHVERYPHFFKGASDKSIYEELLGMTIYAGIDSSTSRDSTSASHYTVEELQQLCAFAKQLRSLVQSSDLTHNNDLRAYVVSAVARLHSIFAHNRFFHFNGHHGARLTYDQSVRGKKVKRRTALIKILSPLLFQAADRRLADLELLWTDETISKVPWKTFIDNMMRDWEQFVINAAVLLNANVAFLDLPGVVRVTGDDGSVSVTLSIAQVASQLSMVTSIGSMVTGLLLVRQHRTKPIETSQEAARYLSSRSSSSVGLETLAIEFSLPYALLMWGMVTFLIAIALVCFGPLGFRVTVPQYVIFGFSWTFVAALVVWTVIINLESSTAFDFDFEDIFYWFKSAISDICKPLSPKVEGEKRTKAKPRRKFTIGRRRVTLPDQADNA